MYRLAVFVLVAASAFSGSAQSGTSCTDMTLGPLGALNGFVPSPQDMWHQDITDAPVDPNSSKIITTPNDLANSHLHPDFSSVVGGNYGIPYNVVDSSMVPSVKVSMVTYPGDSDITPYPMTPSQPIEGSPAACPTDGYDRHSIVIDRNKCVAYEMYQAAYCNGAWSAANGAIWDLTKTEQRPYGMTSADAAGLSIFEGLVRYDEIVAGQINHAIRFTTKFTKDNQNNGYFTAPATHAAGTLWGTDNILGMRIRLKPDFDISGFSQTNQVILRAMKQYGMILADNGSNLYFQGTPDPRWNDDDLAALGTVGSSSFEVVQMAPVYDASTAPTGDAPVITSFTASPSQVTPGGSVTLTPVVTGAVYSFIDPAGFTRGPITVNPSKQTTYTLTSRNAYGSSTATVTVNVIAPMAPPLGPISVKAITITQLSTTDNTATFDAVAKLSSKGSADVTRSALWNTSDTSVATISAGKLTFLQHGTVTVTARSGATISNPVAVAY